MEDTISLREIFAVLKKRLKIISVITITVVLLSIIITSFFITPKYEASTQFIVNQQDDAQEFDYNVNSIRTNVEMINTYNVIIKSPAILKQVIQELSLDQSSGQLSNQIEVSNAQNSQVVNVVVTDANPNHAANIANTTFDVFEKTIPNLMSIDNVSILSPASVGPSPSPVSPNLMLNVAIALFLGLMIGVGIAFLLEFLDKTIKTEQDIDKQLGLPVMGVVATIDMPSTTTPKKETIKSKRGVQYGS
ncbi:capsular biosynthesis protein [Halalkalibacillus sediminis]|uniref:Capsular biosynthesis protein n=1 Tax=Halalkalibacillus sediminis TaxID=2018042 RepID=A0A2I0QU28_9BACI|nr:Wzz/FepE/Etk N-terminal domain-containing protein [Halalkalibacillus sediminis]PKR77804.1 capsular biosynthesis protein [Halalkalibacillus sediminis]